MEACICVDIALANGEKVKNKKQLCITCVDFHTVFDLSSLVGVAAWRFSFKRCAGALFLTQNFWRKICGAQKNELSSMAHGCHSLI